MIKSYLKKLVENQNLDYQEASDALNLIGTGKVNPSQIAAFLMGIQQKNIIATEMAGFRDAMLNLALKIDISEFHAMDLVGTGGDGKNTFNISTTAALVIAGTGQKVAKHGNHGVSSLVGSSTVLEYLGYKFTNSESALKKQLEESNFCFFHAPLFHPAMKYVAPIRKELGIRTFFNILGPLLNPGEVKKMLLGVSDPEIFDLYQEIMANTNFDFGIVFSEDGYDEISLTSNYYLSNKEGINKELSPAKIGFSTFVQKDLEGGDTIAESADIVINILKNNSSIAQKEVVLANAATGLMVAQNIPFEKAKEMAKESIESGKAYEVLKKITQ